MTILIQIAIMNIVSNGKNKLKVKLEYCFINYTMSS